MPISRRRFLALSLAALAVGACTGKRPRLGLALGGGGAKGLAHIPMLEVLDELEIRPHRIAGTSIGAIIGALYAAGLSGRDIRQRLEEFLVSDSDQLIPLPRSLRWLDFIDPALESGGLLDATDFIAFLGELLPVRSFEELKLPLQVVTADLWTGEQLVIQSGELLPALKASMALPGVFPPVTYQGRQLVDGGVANPLPYDLLMDDCDPVVAVDVSGDRSHNGEDPLSFAAVLMHSFHTMSQNILAEKLRHQQPGIYVRPDIRDVRVLEFYKARQVFRQAEPARSELARRLRRFS